MTLRKVTLIGISMLLAAATAVAANVHLKGGRNAEPTFYDNGLSLEAVGAIAGLGNEDGLVTLIAVGNPIATCQNPGNGMHYPPGQNPAPVTVTGTQPIDPDDFEKNGNYLFDVETETPLSPIEGAPDCPNRNWIEEIQDIAFTSATIIVEQPEGSTVLVVQCTFNVPTSDGQVRGSNVSCY